MRPLSPQVLFPLVLFLAASAPLPAQTFRTIRFGSEGEVEAREPRTLQDYLKDLARTRSGHILVLDEEKGALGEGLRRLLGEDPFLDLEVPVWVFTLQDRGLAKELAAQFSWAEQPHWAYVDREGKVRLEGQALPQAQAFHDQLLGAGFVDRGRELEVFLQKHPDHVEAMDQLLGIRLRTANARMKPLYKAPDPPKPGAEGSAPPPPPVVPELQRPLSDQDEQRIWGPAAAGLERLLRSGHGLQAPAWAATFPASARHSAQMRTLATRALPQVEEAVLRAPDQGGPWRAWVKLAACAGRRDLKGLLTQVVMPPGTLPLGAEIPPTPVVREFVRECRGAEDWSALRDAAQATLAHEAAKEDLVAGIFKGQVGFGFGATQDPLFEGLIEAHLRLGEVSKAQQVVQERVVARKRKGAAEGAAKAAERAGRSDLAQVWRQLGGNAKEGGAE